MNSDPKEGVVLQSDLDNLGALASSYDNISSVVNKDTVYKDSDVSTFLLSKRNRDLMYRAANGDTSAVTDLRANWKKYETAQEINLKHKDKTLTDGDVYTYFQTPFSTEIENPHGDTGLAILNTLTNDALSYASAEGKFFSDKEQFVGYLDTLRHIGKSGITLQTPQSFKTAFPETSSAQGVDYKEALSAAITRTLEAMPTAGGYKMEDIVASYDPKAQAWQIYDTATDSSLGVSPVISVEHYRIQDALNKAIRAQKINDQEHLARTVIGVAYTPYKEDTTAEPTSTIVNTPKGKIAVVNTEGFTMTALLQGLRNEVQQSVSSDKVKQDALAQIEIAKNLCTAFKDDSSLRSSVEAATGINYDQLVVSILKPNENELTAISTYDTDDITDVSLHTTSLEEQAVDTVVQKYAEAIKNNAGEDVQVQVSGVEKPLNSTEVASVCKYMLENLYTDENPWGDKNFLSNSDTPVKIKDLILTIGGNSRKRGDSEV